MANRGSTEPRGFLGIEAGGTRTVVHWADEFAPSSLTRHFGPANLQLTSDHDLVHLFEAIRRSFSLPRALAIGMAGARTEADQARLRAAAASVWPATPCLATNDLEIALAADAMGVSQAGSQVAWTAQILVLSGTGSCVYGRDAHGKRSRVGGWGHLLGDQGSGYGIAMEALRGAISAYDRHGIWGPLGRRVLALVHLNEPNALIGWIKTAAKQEIAALAPHVFLAATERDPNARQAVDTAAKHLVTDALICARRLAHPRETVRFCLAGGVFVGQPDFAHRVGGDLVAARARSSVVVLERSGAEGAAALAQSLVASAASKHGSPAPLPSRRVRQVPRCVLPEPTAPSPTEQRNPRSLRLDAMGLEAAITLMLDEEGRALRALRRIGPDIATVIRWVHAALAKGGRLFYVGAGTSGRLGILDASECPPTFRTPPDLIQGILAGGNNAMFRATEGAEDDDEAGAAALRHRGATRKDVVIGIAASGRTPFVWGALREARRRRARTVLLCFNPNLRFPAATRPDLVLAPNLGPEVLTGSTRLKAGTATKWVLNIVSTLSMVRLGKVVSNLMVDLNPSNTKLRDRAVRIVTTLTGATPQDALAALETEEWRVPNAVQRLGRAKVNKVKSGSSRSRETNPRRR
ncbi:MAG: N-acetylmuramic acid 6-phosphate etherase [Verrucomicrobiales bacterium]|nr:N-acetylmuramic acid 6-phosphate etherase [Verrucomicrobiales bacterium]